LLTRFEPDPATLSSNLIKQPYQATLFEQPGFSLELFINPMFINLSLTEAYI